MIRIFVWTVFLTGTSIAVAGDPALLGHHPLNQSQAGILLIAELRCRACHDGLGEAFVPEKVAPDLAEVGARISSEYLQRFLASPSAAHPGTTMPDALAWSSEARRRQIAEAPTHFLAAQAKTAFPTEAAGRIDIGRSLAVVADGAAPRRSGASALKCDP